MDKQAFIKFCRQGNAFDARIPEQINPLISAKTCFSIQVVRFKIVVAFLSAMAR